MLLLFTCTIGCDPVMTFNDSEMKWKLQRIFYVVHMHNVILCFLWNFFGYCVYGIIIKNICIMTLSKNGIIVTLIL